MGRVKNYLSILRMNDKNFKKFDLALVTKHHVAFLIKKPQCFQKKKNNIKNDIPLFLIKRNVNIFQMSSTEISINAFLHLHFLMI